MKFYRYFGRIYGETVAGLVQANNIPEARQILREYYDDYNEWNERTIKPVKFDDNVCEVYYGC